MCPVGGLGPRGFDFLGSGAVLGVPVVVTVGPRQWREEAGPEEMEGPGQKDDVVDVAKESHHGGANTDS